MGLLAAAAFGLAACDPLPPSSNPPAPRPVRPNAPAPEAPNAASGALSQYYARVQQQLLTQGLLRTDGGGPDAPFSARQLADNFERIALYEEYTNIGGRLVAQQTASRLRRWEGPVRISLEFGASIPETQRAKDSASVAKYVARLGRVTGHPIRMTSSGANFHVLVMNENERGNLDDLLRARIPGISQAALNSVRNIDRSTYCLVFAIDARNDGAYTQAVALIRGEHPDLLRRSCIHEELAQGLGLANDSPQARPSIFNDDEEFALLTTHDEYLLRILYDARLRAGMTAGEARDIARAIAEELIGGES